MSTVTPGVRQWPTRAPSGVTTQLVFPVPQLLVVAVLAALAGLLAAIAPSSRAAKVDILQAVTTE